MSPEDAPLKPEGAKAWELRMVWVGALIIYLAWYWYAEQWHRSHQRLETAAWLGLIMLPTEGLGLVFGAALIAFPKNKALIITFLVLCILHLLAGLQGELPI